MFFFARLREICSCRGHRVIFSVHHGEVKEMMLMQSSAFPFPQQMGPGFFKEMAHTNSLSDELGFDAFETLCLNA